jgi:Flp pilus assembly protein TadD
MKEAAEALGKAAKLLPGRTGVHYNHGLALQQLGQKDQAEAALLRAQQLDPKDPNPPYALAVFYAQKGQKDRALQWAEMLLSLRPADPQVIGFVNSLRANR